MKLQDAKVAWILPAFGIDGNLLYIKPLLENLSKQCGAFRVFTAEFKGNKDVFEFEIERQGTMKRSYQLERHATQGADGYVGGVSFVTPTVVTSLLKYRPDLMVLQEFSLLSLYAILARQLISRIRVLLLVEASPRLTQSKWISVARKILRTFIVKKADSILTNNLDGRNYLTMDLQAPYQKIHVRPYLVSDMAFLSGISKVDLWKNRSERGIELPVRFLYVGQLVRRKGLQHALESLAMLIPDYRGRFVFNVVGDGPFRESLEQQTRELGLSEYVQFHGRQPYETLWKWYKRSDVFLFPTLVDYRALVPFEALSMGLPLVASIHDGGVGETIESGWNGFSIDPRDTVRFAMILARFLDWPGIIKGFGQKSLEIASAYTLERATESLANACQQALDSTPDA